MKRDVAEGMRLCAKQPDKPISDAVKLNESDPLLLGSHCQCPVVASTTRFWIPVDFGLCVIPNRIPPKTAKALKKKSKRLFLVNFRQPKGRCMAARKM